ncbi:MAG: RsfS/YbeB/iojap family protein, partial [Clostridiales bacterium]
MDVEKMLQKGIVCIFEKKGDDILSLDIRAISSMADYFLLCTVNNTPQAKGVADALKDQFAEEDMLP